MLLQAIGLGAQGHLGGLGSQSEYVGVDQLSSSTELLLASWSHVSMAVDAWVLEGARVRIPHRSFNKKNIFFRVMLPTEQVTLLMAFVSISSDDFAVK